MKNPVIIIESARVDCNGVILCKAPAEGFLIPPGKGMILVSCVEHGNRVVQEYKKLGEDWTFTPGVRVADPVNPYWKPW